MWESVQTDLRWWTPRGVVEVAVAEAVVVSLLKVVRPGAPSSVLALEKRKLPQMSEELRFSTVQ